MKMKGYSVTTFKIEGQTNSIRITKHALKRLKDRKLSKNTVISHILELSKKNIYRFRSERPIRI